MDKTFIIIAIVAVLGLIAYLMFFKKNISTAPPVMIQKQSAQQSLTGKLEDAAIGVGVNAANTAANNWLSSVDW